ncbi:pantetheine-phosphate adenylyltransferase [Lapidilactobacillus luobeiensis]|uniref:pantetheine-phosphate adenylyltransferase n=1 Tax=Lapidilactobacillus luobeiensis TaxID=2950371 RepID=UPI0021C2DB48|nr:pantetheine-phosphate adenylyltransferase [Lapidilactobacillus luobeiensis]
MKRVALFAGSFDPLTQGHLVTLEKALDLFDEVVVGVMTNGSKHYLLSVDERVAIIRAAVKDDPRVQVIARPAGLTTSLARELGAQFLVRGLRNSDDFTYESGIAAMNASLAPEIQTIFLLTDPKLAYVSSSMIKEVLTFGGDVSTYLTPLAIKLLRQKLLPTPDQTC